MREMIWREEIWRAEMRVREDLWNGIGLEGLSLPEDDGRRRTDIVACTAGNGSKSSSSVVSPESAKPC
jgi:hypothetical protein